MPSGTGKTISLLSLIVAYILVIISDTTCLAGSRLGGGEGRGYSGFKVIGLIRRFFWVRNFPLQDLWGRKIWQVFFVVP